MADRKLGVAAIIAAPVIVLGGALGGLLLLGSPSSACNPSTSLSATVRDAGAPQPVIDGYSGVQLVNAADIINAGAALGLGVRDQTIGVMTAMGESALTVADHGDQVGPDSRGLFQQRDNGAWETLADRMDPTTSATNFFKALQAVANRDSLAPTIVANKVQRNADPYYYETYWGPAVAVVEALTGTSTGMANDTGGAVCTTTRGAPGVVNAQGWANPATGPITSPYGWRVHPVYGDLRFHTGDDIGAACGAPIWAAGPGSRRRLPGHRPRPAVLPARGAPVQDRLGPAGPAWERVDAASAAALGAHPAGGRRTHRRRTAGQVPPPAPGQPRPLRPPRRADLRGPHRRARSACPAPPHQPAKELFMTAD